MDDNRLLEWMTETSKTLGEIEGTVKQNTKMIDELRGACGKLPEIELGLNNHLSTHDKMQNRLWWPLALLIISWIVVLFLKLAFKISV